jgi:hypothetical protein
MIQEISKNQIPDGVRYARLTGRLLGVFLICMGTLSLVASLSGSFDCFKAVYFVVYGSLLNLPFDRMAKRPWKWSFGLLIASSIAFVFVMIISVIFDYMAADARGERLGVPGFEGTLIFFALLQVPAVLFQRNPDLLN